MSRRPPRVDRNGLRGDRLKCRHHLTNARRLRLQGHRETAAFYLNVAAQHLRAALAAAGVR